MLSGVRNAMERQGKVRQIRKPPEGLRLVRIRHCLFDQRSCQVVNENGVSVFVQQPFQTLDEEVDILSDKYRRSPQNSFQEFASVNIDRKWRAPAEHGVQRPGNSASRVVDKENQKRRRQLTQIRMMPRFRQRVGHPDP